MADSFLKYFKDKKSKAPASKPIAIRIPTDLLEEIRRLAKVNKSSTSEIVIEMVRFCLEHQKR